VVGMQPLRILVQLEHTVCPGAAPA
jgi:hypothetical protein